MARQNNTDRKGGQWSEETKKTVWQKGSVIPNYSPDLWRWDKCGLVMKWTEHGNRESEHGWEIDHINPVSNNGDDHINNLQPLNWKNNSDKADKLDWTCPSRD
jgi:5-methylcytosine-specific restriction endonuclease McrA